MDADIIVIGASPAGVMAARNASRKGCKVILLDKRKLQVCQHTLPTPSLKECSTAQERKWTRAMSSRTSKVPIS